MFNSAPIRISEIDGIRGWAALIVLLFHTYGEMLKIVVPAVQSAWFTPILSGDTAVAVFFVLSGDALSSSFFGGGGLIAVDRLIVRRYFRLTIPIFLSCLITYLIMMAGLDYHKEAAVVLRRPDWLGQFLQINESLLGLLRYSLIGVYTSHTTELSYNPFLWTMSVEMVGSILVFILCLVWDRLKKPQWICGILAIYLIAIGSAFGLFFAGMLLAFYRRQGYFEKLLIQRNHQILALVVVSTIFILSILTSGMFGSFVVRFFIPIVAVLLIFFSYTQKRLKSFFSNKLSIFLGEISFPLYLVHFQILISLMSWLVLRDFTTKGMVDQNSMLVFGSVTVCASLFAALCFRFVERFTLKIVDSLVLQALI